MPRVPATLHPKSHCRLGRQRTPVAAGSATAFSLRLPGQPRRDYRARSILKSRQGLQGLPGGCWCYPNDSTRAEIKPPTTKWTFRGLTRLSELLLFARGSTIEAREIGSF